MRDLPVVYHIAPASAFRGGEWGGDNRLELPDTPEGRAAMMNFIKEIMAAGYRLNSAAIEEDGQHREYIKAPETPPAPDGESKSA